MEVVESPVYRSWPPHGDKTERFWRFVLFSVDALASVAGLEDAEATRAASALPRTKFLGIIIGPGDVAVLQPNFEYLLTLELLLVGVGLPDEYEHACVPIAPTSFHPEGRPMTQTTAPLPWDNLYVYTRRSFNALISRIHVGANPSDIHIPEAHRDVVIRSWSRDRQAMVAESMAAMEAAEAANAAFVKQVSGLDEEGSGSETETESSDSEPAMDDDTRNLYKKLSTARPCVDFWFDLSECPTADDIGLPRDFVTNIVEMRGIWKAWEERATTELLAKRPQTTAWAQDVANSGPIAPPLDPVDGEGAGDLPITNDFIVEPEDAIDADDQSLHGSAQSNGSSAKSLSPPMHGAPQSRPSQPVVTEGDQVDKSADHHAVEIEPPVSSSDHAVVPKQPSAVTNHSPSAERVIARKRRFPLTSEAVSVVRSFAGRAAMFVRVTFRKAPRET